jgi:squalene-hopene/tetraprenyl-beta-curcumene cyclase
MVRGTVSTGKMPDSFSAAPAPAALHSAIELTSEWLLERQAPQGYWCAELEGDTILESEYILLLAWLGRENSDIARKAAEYIRRKQLPTGGWSQYPGGKLDLSVSVKAYFALKLTGHDPSCDFMQRAREAIRAAGGADRVNSFTRYYLALLGQISYDFVPAVPPEFILLPTWIPANIYRISAWSRTMFIPLSIVWAHKPRRELPKHLGIEELFVEPVERWPELRCPGLAPESGWFRWEPWFRRADALLKTFDRWGLRPLRQRALRDAQEWMLSRFTLSDGLGAIFPPIIWSIVALKCRGFAEDSAEVRYNFEQLADLTIEEDETVRLQPCKSPVWDTAITLRALAAAGKKLPDRAVARAVDWLLDKEVTQTGDWAARVACEPGGWFFEHHNEYYPDVDDTVMVLMGLKAVADSEAASAGRGSGSYAIVRTASMNEAREQSARITKLLAACERGRKWVQAMQNRDGGWGAFDRDNDAEWLCRVPFADHNAMIDPSTPDLAGRVIEALADWGGERGQPTIDRALAYLRKTQEPDGSWFGRWGVNYIYGTWQALVGLAKLGINRRDPAVNRGVQWLLEHQQADGGWGESADSYEQPELRGQGEPTPSQTAWALLGLLSAGLAAHPAVARGVQWLLDHQLADGDWEETQFTGTGFPRVFYLRYHYYRVYFPLLALATYRAACSVCEATTTKIVREGAAL